MGGEKLSDSQGHGKGEGEGGKLLCEEKRGLLGREGGGEGHTSHGGNILALSSGQIINIGRRRKKRKKK